MYSTEVEEQFGFFTDFADTFPLYRGKGSRDPDESEGQVCGYLKGTVKVYPLPAEGPAPEKILSTHSVPSTSSEECVVRVYVIKVSELVLCFSFIQWCVVRVARHLKDYWLVVLR